MGTNDESENQYFFSQASAGVKKNAAAVD